MLRNTTLVVQCLQGDAQSWGIVSCKNASRLHVQSDELESVFERDISPLFDTDLARVLGLLEQAASGEPGNIRTSLNLTSVGHAKPVPVRVEFVPMLDEDSDTRRVTLLLAQDHNSPRAPQRKDLFSTLEGVCDAVIRFSATTLDILDATSDSVTELSGVEIIYGRSIVSDVLDTGYTEQMLDYLNDAVDQGTKSFRCVTRLRNGERVECRGMCENTMRSSSSSSHSLIVCIGFTKMANTAQQQQLQLASLRLALDAKGTGNVIEEPTSSVNPTPHTSPRLSSRKASRILADEVAFETLEGAANSFLIGSFGAAAAAAAADTKRSPSLSPVPTCSGRVSGMVTPKITSRIRSGATSPTGSISSSSSAAVTPRESKACAR